MPLNSNGQQPPHEHKKVVKMSDPRIVKVLSIHNLVFCLVSIASPFLAWLYLSNYPSSHGNFKLRLFKLGLMPGTIIIALVQLVSSLTKLFQPGCQKCRSELHCVHIPFSPTLYGPVLGVLEAGDPAAIAYMATAPNVPADAKQVVRIHAAYCASCHAIGTAKVCIDEIGGERYQTKSFSRDIILVDQQVKALSHLATVRASADQAFKERTTEKRYDPGDG